MILTNKVLTKVMTKSKPSKDNSLQGLKEAIIKHHCLVPDSEKEEWEESDCALHLHNLWRSQDSCLVASEEFK